VLALASIVGSKGRVVGIDNSETLIVEARNRAEGVGGHVDFQVKDAHDLDFADNTFDACRADRVFQHLEKPEQALSEMVRVARRGACIVVSEPDWETFVVDMPNRTLTRKILNYFCDEHQNGWCGRGLHRLFNEAGLLSISIVARTLILTDLALADQLHELRLTADKLREAGELTATEADEWSEYLKSSSKAGQFFCAVTGFAASGCKPT
jgi:ubiquinone/menaquinone biosynthesis C-methylase UbiE